jgi:hypothetical protein
MILLGRAHQWHGCWNSTKPLNPYHSRRGMMFKEGCLNPNHSRRGMMFKEGCKLGAAV